MIKKDIGTEIILTLRDDVEDEEEKEIFSQFLEDYEIKQLVKKYSDYVRYPIHLSGEVEPLNQMTPLWKRSKQDINGS